MRKFVEVLVFVFLVAVIGGYGLSQQNNNSTQPGLINFVEGAVYLNNQLLTQDIKDLPKMKEYDQLITHDGRAEVLLAPGVFMRLDTATKIKIISNRLLETKVEVSAGSVLVECVEVHKYNKLIFASNDAVIKLKKKGLYRLDVEVDAEAYPFRLRVYDGEAEVELPFGAVTDVKKGREVFLATGKAGKFNRKEEDNLIRWSHVRAEFMASVNLAAAKALLISGILWQLSAWRWSEHFHCYAYIPYGRDIHSFYGYRYWNPFEISRSFADYNLRSGNRGSSGSSDANRGGHSGGVQNSPTGANVETEKSGDKSKAKEPVKNEPAKVDAKKKPPLAN